MRGGLARAGRVLLATGRNFYSDNCLDLSATVAFYTLLSLGPLLYLVGGTLNLALDANSALEGALARAGAFLPPEAVALLHVVVESLRRDQPLFLLAVPGLIWVATSAFSALEYAINVASATAPMRRFWHSRLKALLVLTTGWILVGLSLLAGSVFPWLERMSETLGLPPNFLALPDLESAYPLQLLATWLVFAGFYKFLPRGRVAWRAALSGAAVALVLWEAARRLFTMLLARSPAFGLLTGTVAGVVAFLVWIYTAVAIVLLGAELSAVLNGNRRAE